LSKAVTILSTALALVVFSYVPVRAEAPPLGKDKLTIAHASWSSSLGITMLGKLLLEKIGYKVDLKQLDTGLIYQSLSTGSVDVFFSAWLPGQQSYLNKLGNKLDLISMAYGPAPGGLAVPAYVPVNSIEDLKKPDVAAMFGGKIVGIDAGSGIMIKAKAVQAAYGLNMELITSSGAAMAAAFKSAYENKQPIVVTGWCPTAMCALYGLKFLEDPKKIFGETRNWHVARLGFRSDYPRALALLSRFTLVETQLSKMLVWIESEGVKPEVAAARFVDENPDLIWYMIGDLAPDMAKPNVLN
jgi:ABC-type proline/glycine betaine transport system substrate-binding protein